MQVQIELRELELPLAFLPTSGEPTRIPRAKRIFANRGLKLSQVDWVGFDMNYTLAIYRQEEMDSLSVELIIDRLPKPSARRVASSRVRADTEAYIVLSAPNTAPIAIRIASG